MRSLIRQLTASDILVWVGLVVLIAAGVAVSGFLPLIWPGLAR